MKREDMGSIPAHSKWFHYSALRHKEAEKMDLDDFNCEFNVDTK